jgi:hypothetical protein
MESGYGVPIPKSGAPKSIDNELRPIPLTPTLHKVLESFVGRWVLPALPNQFDLRQFGAIKGRSTTNALTDTVNTWHQALHNSQPSMAKRYFSTIAKHLILLIMQQFWLKCQRLILTPK